MLTTAPALARMVVRKRFAFLLAWAAVFLLLAPRATRLPLLLTGSAQLENSESNAVERLMRGPLASAYSRNAVLVARGIPAPSSEAGTRVLRLIVERVAAAPQVTGVFSYLSVRDAFFLGEAGDGTVILVGLAADSAAPEQLIPPLRALTAELVRELRAAHPNATLRWTGETALNVDLRATSTADVERAERRALPATALMLLFAFGTIVAALLPVAAGALAIAVALGAAAIAAQFWPLSLLLQSVVTMLGLGLGIDYALLLVSRYREALAEHGNVVGAAVAATQHAGHTILLSAATVALGFLALLMIPLDELRAVAAGGLLAVTVSALVATTLLPGLLALLGTRIEYGRVTRRSTPARSHERWRRWGLFVTARPWLALLFGGVPLLVLAAQSARLRTGIPRGDWLPAVMESTRALDDLAAMQRAGLIHDIRLVIQLPHEASLWQERSWNEVARYATSLASDPAVARVRSLIGAIQDAGLTRAGFMALPPALKTRLTRGNVSEDGRLVLLDVIPRESVNADDAVRMVRELRTRGAGIENARVLVGGLPAFNADYHDTVAGRFVWIVGLVIVVTMLALFVAFRSVLIPLKAVVLNLLSVAAAFGAVTVVFQEGHAAWLNGLTEPTGTVFSSLPVIVFCVVFGLSMDYEIFLIARVRELRRAGAADRDAIVEALARTGTVITNAAAVMLVVFAAFTLGDVLITKMLGFALVVAVFIDATVVRMVVGPALLRLAGRWNWWPGNGQEHQPAAGPEPSGPAREAGSQQPRYAA